VQVAIVQFAGGGRQADPAEQVVDARLRRVELRIEEALLRVEHVEVGARATSRPSVVPPSAVSGRPQALALTHARVDARAWTDDAAHCAS